MSEEAAAPKPVQALPLLRDFTGTPEQALRVALQMLYDETEDYQRRNNLGGHDNHCMRLAREALALSAHPEQGSVMREAETPNNSFPTA